MEITLYIGWPRHARAYGLILFLLLAQFSFFAPSFFSGAISAPGIGNTQEPGSATKACDYVVYPDGSTILASKGDGTGNKYSGTVATTVIQNALNDLTAGRTVKEKLCVKGSLTITAKITIPSYTILNLEGSKLTFGNSISTAMFENSDTTNGNTQIDILGGIIDGNKANQASGNYGAVQFNKVTDFLIMGLQIQNCKDKGFHILGLTATLRGRIIGNQVSNCDGYSFAIYADHMTVTSNIAFHSEVISADFFNIDGDYNTYEANLVRNPGGGNGDCFAIDGLDYSVIKGNVCQNVRNGLRFYAIKSSNRNLLEGNMLKGQGADAFYGIVVATSAGEINHFLGNFIESFSEVATGYGILIGDDYNTILYNDVTTNRVPLSVTGGLLGVTVRYNRGYTTENQGATSVADGGTISHGLAATPTSVQCTTSIASQFCSVTALASTTFTVAIKTDTGATGTTQTIYWWAVYWP